MLVLKIIETNLIIIIFDHFQMSWAEIWIETFHILLCYFHYQLYGCFFSHFLGQTFFCLGKKTHLLQNFRTPSINYLQAHAQIAIPNSHLNLVGDFMVIMVISKTTI